MIVVRTFRRIRVGLLLLLLGATVVVPQVASSDDNKSECKRSQDCALDAFKSGDIRTLSDVLVAVREKVPGEVIKVKLTREDGVWVYEVKVLTPSGRRREVEINAQTLAVIKVD